MSRPVFYMAHPVSAPNAQGELPPAHTSRYNLRSWRRTSLYRGMQTNLIGAKRWLRELQQWDRSRVYIAPWISEVEAFLNRTIDTTYEQALQDDEEVVSRCDGIILVGGKISGGMQRELDVMRAKGGEVIDLSRWRTPRFTITVDIREYLKLTMEAKHGAHQ